MPAFKSSSVQFDEASTTRLRACGFSEATIAHLSSEIGYSRDFFAMSPATRRTRIREMKDLADAFRGAHHALAKSNFWTRETLEPHAFQRGLAKERPILLDDLRNALASYIAGADAATAVIAEKGYATRGPEGSEYRSHIVSMVAEVLRGADIEINAHEKGAFVTAITISYEVLGIADGIPKADAQRALKK